MNTTNDDRRGAVAGPVKRPVRPLVERLHAYSADTNLSQRYSDAMQDAAEEIKRLRSLLAAPDNGYDDCWPGRAPHRAVLLGDVSENYSADAERFRWLAEHTVATGLARWVHPFQFLAEAVDARRNEATTNAAPRVTTAAELRQQAKSDTSCVGAFARARPGKA